MYNTQNLIKTTREITFKLTRPLKKPSKIYKCKSQLSRWCNPEKDNKSTKNDYEIYTKKKS